MSELIGVLPAAGRGSRLGPIPTSKEIMPLGFEAGHQFAEGQGEGWRPFTTIEAHLHSFRLAGIEKVTVILGSNKQDIMEYLGSGVRFGLTISYLFQEELRGMPFALDLARPWSVGATTVFTMPDTLIEPAGSVARLVKSHQETAADLSLGLFETNNPKKFGMVELDSDGKIVRFDDKPAKTDLRLMWGLAVWSPKFAEFMHERLGNIALTSNETVLSDLFDAALKSGLSVRGFELDGANYNDIGTPEEFQRVVRRLAMRAASDLVEEATE